MSRQRNSAARLAARAFLPIVLGLLAGACGGSGSSGSPTGASPGTPTTPTSTAPVATNSVAIRFSAFTPQDIQVSPGIVVTFSNLDNAEHNVTFSAGVQSVGNYSSGDRTVQMPTAPGTYPYRCTLHGGMTGSVQVK